MKLVIVHYHLNRGGVTRVIESHVKALSELEPSRHPESVTILHGGRVDGWQAELIQSPFPVEHRAMSGLDYDEIQKESESSAARVHTLFAQLQEALNEAGCHPDSTVLHVHNHGLGKNASLLDVIDRLIGDGWRLLLQVHDFAEELRPDNYGRMLDHYQSTCDLQGRLYPQADTVHYAALTQRDANVLATARIPAERIHLLPNPVSKAATSADRKVARGKLREQYGLDEDRPLVVYPVRGIRRKNVGELLLWAVMNPDVVFAITMAPKNPAELLSFDHWRMVAESQRLRVLFDIGGSGGMTLEESYASADAIITTSIAEGFGLVFLEASLMGLELLGRDLPGVTADFRKCGMRFPGLATETVVPARLIDVERLKEHYIAHAVEMNDLYAAGMPTPSIEAEVGELLSGDWLDFARLDRSAQEKVLCQLAANEELRNEVADRNSVFGVLGKLLEPSEESTLGKDVRVAVANQRAIPAAFGLQVVGNAYATILDCVVNSSPSQRENDASIGQAVLGGFLKLANLYPLRLDP